MTYIRESTIELHMVVQVKAGGGTSYQRRSVPDRLMLLPYSSSAKRPVIHYTSTSCVSMNGCTRWTLRGTTG